MEQLELSSKINDIIKFLKSKTTLIPEIGIIMGTGLGGYANKIAIETEISYGDIPHLPHATAPGHSGRLLFGTVSGKKVVAMQGRLHAYEGNSPQTISMLIRAMKKLGIHTLLISCAAGGLNYRFKAGDIMLIEDHINMTGASPLTGQNLNEFGPRFPVMFDIYDKKLANQLVNVAMEKQIPLQRGIYTGYSGPHYCTRAEVNMFIKVGGDAVGMSVVHEAITAAHAGIKIVALAAITDLAHPYVYEHASEDEVIESGKIITTKFEQLVSEFLKTI